MIFVLPRPCRRGLAAVALIAMLGAACSEPDHTSEEFCEKLGQVTGPTGIEAALTPGDPARIDGVVNELAELHTRAPEEISATTRTMLTFFQAYQRAPRDERRDVLAENESSIVQASKRLNSYALDECGLFLQRAVPTPVPTVNPSIEAPAE